MGDLRVVPLKGQLYQRAEVDFDGVDMSLQLRATKVAWRTRKTPGIYPPER